MTFVGKSFHHCLSSFIQNRDILFSRDILLKKKKKSFLGGSATKESTCNVGDLDCNPELGRSPREGNNYPFHYSCLENSMDKRAWWATVHRVTDSDMTEET